MISLPEIKKLIISGILSVFLLTNFLFVFTPSAHAQARSTPPPTWYNQDFKTWYKKVYDSPPNDVFGERYTAANVEWIIYGLFAFIINKFTGDPKATSCYMNNDLKNCLSYLKNALSFATPASSEFAENNKPQGILSYIFLQDRPLSGITYFRNVARNWHLIPEAKAQTPGFGFNALNPVLPLWRASRNVAYALLVFAIIILSFMIMFRVKINPQTVVTVQSAIPKVVFALILITFSYAIAGFMVDLMYVFIGLLSLILSQAFSGISGIPIFNIGISGINVGTGPQTFFGFMTNGPLNLGILSSLGIYIVLFLISTFIGLLGANGIVGALTSTITTLSIFPGVIALFAVLLTIVVAILLLFIAIRVIWMLLKAFAYVLLLVAFAPLQIALGIIVPGIGFGPWLKSLLANLSVFPVTGLFVAIAYLFLLMVLQQTFANLLPQDAAGLLRQIIGGTGPIGGIIVFQQGWPPLLSIGVQNVAAIIYLGVSLVMLFILPKVSDIIKAVIEGKPFEFGTAIGEAVGLPVAAGRYGVAGGVGTIGERVTRRFSEREREFIDPLIQQLQKMIAGGR